MYKVADFFCGGGGFSEGFRLAGCETIFAVDKWEPAVVTHHTNHSNAKTIKDDVLRISRLSDKEFNDLVPDTEIIIGSPPCTFFSNSNRSGKADKTLGIELIKAYLRIVARKLLKENSILKYWVLENVPNVDKYIQDKYLFRDLDINKDGYLQVKYSSSGVYNCKYFSVASNRLRYFCGKFPNLTQTINSEIDTITINNILEKLGEPKQALESQIIDPNYNDFSMKSKNITDHHYFMEIAEFEWKKAKRLKEDKGYMGKMSFPENFNKPSRTVMATLSSGTRESLIYPYKNFKNRFRLPTVREIASLMSYPLDYRFVGDSKSIKYKLVGNSVPPKMSFAIACAILQKENIPVQNRYIPKQFISNKKFLNLNGKIFKKTIEKEKIIKSKFKYHIPYLKINAYRVELLNHDSDFNNENFIWSAEIHRGQGSSAKIYNINIEYLDNIIKTNKSIRSFLDEIKEKIVDANKFQYIYCQTTEYRKKENLMGPFELLELLRKLIDKQKIKDEETIFIEEINQKVPYSTIIGYFILKQIVNLINRK